MLAINVSLLYLDTEKYYHFPYSPNPQDFLFYLSIIPIFLLAELPDLKMLEKPENVYITNLLFLSLNQI